MGLAITKSVCVCICVGVSVAIGVGVRVGVCEHVGTLTCAAQATFGSKQCICISCQSTTVEACM
jgi:hypothetical protein